METNELDNQNRGEVLESLKDKCKSIVKLNLYLGLLVWILVVLCLIFGGIKLDNPKNVYYSIFFIAVAVFGVVIAD